MKSCFGGLPVVYVEVKSHGHAILFEIIEQPQYVLPSPQSKFKYSYAKAIVQVAAKAQVV